MNTVDDIDVMNIKFENFINTLENEDLLDKTIRIDKVLNSGVLTGNEALGVIGVNKLSSKIKLKEKMGTFIKQLCLVLILI